jgi:two-component system, chemotaxis family, protein-glutamate methylesterase/glutaminase
VIVEQQHDRVTAPERHHIVVIGASAGGVETLQRVVSGLPDDLPATICIVLHVHPGSPSALASILRRATTLPCRAAVDGEDLHDGEILVAPPDRHLAIADSHVTLTVGPRENGHRPSVDVLFRSAAEAHDGRVIGVVLSGTRDDGTAGLAVIKAHGGGTIVQDPEEALYAGMPANAIAHVDVDRVVPSGEIADAIVSMVHEGPPAADHPRNPGPAPLPGTPVLTACPECGGVLDEHREAGLTQWRCKVGHRYSPESLADAQGESVEASMWVAVRALEDRQALLERMGMQLESRGHTRSATSFRRRAREAAAHARVVRAALAEAASTTLERIEAGGDGASAEDRVV